MDLVTCAADSHVSRAENIIRFVKKRLRSIQSETPFTKYLRRLTIKMTTRATVLINSFRRKSGVHYVMSQRQILFGKKFKTPLCKMGDLVLASNVKPTTRHHAQKHSMNYTLDQMMVVLIIQYSSSQ